MYGCRLAQVEGSSFPENGERMRKCRANGERGEGRENEKIEREKMERMGKWRERDIYSLSMSFLSCHCISIFFLYFLIFSFSLYLLTISSFSRHCLHCLYFVIFSQFSHSLSISLHFLILSTFSLSLVMNNNRSPLYWGSFLKGSVHKNASKMDVAPWSPMDGM